MTKKETLELLGKLLEDIESKSSEELFEYMYNNSESFRKLMEQNMDTETMINELKQEVF